MVWEHPVSLALVYVGFYLATVFISLSIGEWAHGELYGACQLPALQLPCLH
jgi:hypothetical protein